MAEKTQRPFYQNVDGMNLPGLFLPEAYRSALKYDPKPNDFFIVTFPKCGTTWTQQIVSLIYNRGVSASTNEEFQKQTVFLELHGAQAADKLQRPGTIKVHLPYDLTPKAPCAKYLYVARNPKDTVVSFYHHTRTSMYRFAEGEFDDFFEVFINGENDFGDYFDHVLSWYENRHNPNVMFLTYEELRQDTPNMVKKIANFMGENYLDMFEKEPEILDLVLKYSKVEHMQFLNVKFDNFLDDNKKNLDSAATQHAAKYFTETEKKPGEVFEKVREGSLGGWRKYFSDEQNLRMDNKIRAKLSGTDLYEYWMKIGCI